MSGDAMICCEENTFTDFDREFGDFLLRFSKCDCPELMVAGMLLTRELRNGRTKLDLNDYAGKTLTLSDDKTVELPSAAEWMAKLTSGEVNGIAVPVDCKESNSLLVLLNDHTLMLRRYLNYEKDIAARLVSCRRFNENIICDFERSSDWVQDLAVFAALNSSLTILTGGPGTGKTTVCGRILREILTRDPDKRILFAAPTGKAQQRLAAQISESAELLEHDSEAYRAMKSVEGATIHSFRYNRSWRSKLNFCDLLIVDECSMIPVALFAELLKLLPQGCSLLLAGDRRQLPPVESGTVFADLCRSGQSNVLPMAVNDIFNSRYNGAAGVAADGDFSGFIVELQNNYRSAKAPTICYLAGLLRDESADIDHVVSEIVDSGGKDYKFVTLNNKIYPDLLRKKCRIMAELPKLCASGSIADIKAALAFSESFRFLCAVNTREQGCDNVNRMVLDELGLTPDFPGAWKPGTLLIIRSNDYQIGLRNGDTGIVTSEFDDEGKKRTFCRLHSCPERRFHVGDLPEHECGFAISIHKAQGSGYKEAVVILPGYNSAVLERKLIYTGITRAAENLELWGTPEELRFALERNESHSANLFRMEQ